VLPFKGDRKKAVMGKEPFCPPHVIARPVAKNEYCLTHNNASVNFLDTVTKTGLSSSKYPCLYKRKSHIKINQKE
jgi:hypothetical protein